MAHLAADILCNDVARAAIAVILLVGTFILLVTDREVPPALWGMDGLAVGFYFGGVVSTALLKRGS